MRMHVQRLLAQLRGGVDEGGADSEQHCDKASPAWHHRSAPQNEFGGNVEETSDPSHRCLGAKAFEQLCCALKCCFLPEKVATTRQALPLCEQALGGQDTDSMHRQGCCTTCGTGPKKRRMHRQGLRLTMRAGPWCPACTRSRPRPMCRGCRWASSRPHWRRTLMRSGTRRNPAPGISTSAPQHPPCQTLSTTGSLLLDLRDNLVDAQQNLHMHMHACCVRLDVQDTHCGE